VRARGLIVVLFLLAVAAWPARPQSQVVSTLTSPRQEFGAAIGDDYFLTTYTQLEAYWQKLDRESDRMQLVDIGRTAEGRSQWMAIVSAPENLRQLDRYRDVSRRLALAEGLSDDQARELASAGKAVVWISGGLHADEVLGAQQLLELVHQLVSGADPETERIRRDVIVLAAHANPDGHELVSTWYMRERDPLRRRLSGIPRAYQKYIGHDNNRDFFMSTQAETINMNRVLYREWLPQVVYDHHQAGPPGTVMFAPPFRDPFNYVFDPLIPAGIDLLGAAMHARFAVEGKPGVTMRTGSNYSTWWNGGLRTTAYFHNQIGLLTETIGTPTPSEIPLVASRQVASVDLPHPITPQPWRFRQSVDYSMTANRAVLDLASRYRETLLFNAYRMGKNSIQRGSQDSWTITPTRRGGNPASRDARAYILPSSQPDFLTATKFVDALLKNGITVWRATAPFLAEGKGYPAGSFIVKTAQAFRPHVLDMFEAQDHPNDMPYPGAPPTPPYDNAGWTLAFQMGVKFDRVLEGVDGPFEKVERVSPPPGRVDGGAGQAAAGYLVSHHQNDAFVAVNRLLRAGEEVYWPRDRTLNAMYIAAKPSTLPILRRAAADLGLTFTGVAAPPPGEALKLAPVRIGLWDRYGGASTSGWVRWLLERYEFPFEVVYAQMLDAGDLSRFDVLILPDEAVPTAGRGRGDDGSSIDNLPEEYRSTTGTITRARTVPRLITFVEDGGTLITIGGATVIGEAMGAVSNALMEPTAGGMRPLPREKYYIPGSVLRASVDTTTPLGYGFEPEVDVFFDNSPVFTLDAAGRGSQVVDAAAVGRGSQRSPAGPTNGPAVRKVAWFASPSPLRSGWAWGQRYLDGGVAVADAAIGRGRVLVFGPEIVFRAQSHGTFKFLFNGIFYSRAKTVGSRQ
jgi:hypothetical protein